MQRWTLFLLLFLLIGCDASLDVITQSLSANTVTLSSGQPRTLDPALTFGDAGGPIGLIFSGVVTLDQNLQVQPDLAIGWDVNDAGTQYTFFLHPEARFHDGRNLTSADIKFSWERALDPATGSDTAATYLGDITVIEALDTKVLRVTIDAPKPYFLAKLTYPVAFVVDQQQVSDSTWERTPNGTGPFKLETWRDDQLIVLTKNDDYYAERGNVTQVRYEMDAGLPLSLYELDEIDVVGIGGSTLERARDPNEAFSTDLRTIPSLCTTFVGLNHNLPPFDDVRVRQAFNYALDKERIIEGLLRDNALPSNGVLPPGMPGFAVRDVYPFNPDLARQLLAESGFDTSQPLIYTSSGYSDVGGLPTASIAMWEEVLGVRIEAELIEPFNYAPRLYAGEMGHFFNFGWCADYVDPQNFLDILFHSSSPQNWGRFANPTIDAQLEAAQIEPDVQTRLQLYADIENQIIDEAAYIFVSHSISSLLVQPRIENYVLTPVGIPQWHRVNINE